MNIIIIAAILGWLWTELNAVRPVLKETGDKFDITYYLRHNVLNIFLNIVGTGLVYLMAPAITLFLRWFLEKWTEDPALIATMSDYVLAPITGATIGLFGSWFVRKIVDKGKSKVDPNEKPSE